MIPVKILSLFAFICLGLIVGSFLTMLAHRLPLMLYGVQIKKQRISWFYPPRSYCPQCQSIIPWYGNIPLISFIMLRAKCAHCRQTIAKQYLLIEITSLCMTLLIILTQGLTLQAAGLLILGWALLALAVMDIQHQILPDQITLPFLWLGLLCNSFGLYHSASHAIWGAAFVYTLLWTIYWLFWLLRGKEGLGFGDFKLLAVVGAWGGWPVVLPTLLFAALLGLLCNLPLLMRKRYEQAIPFGPYLAICGWLLLLFPQFQRFF